MAVFPAFFVALMAALVTGQVEITPQLAVKRIGDELTVTCRVPYSIDSCRMTIGTTPYRLLPENKDGDVIYSGRGLTVGDCGALIKNITEEYNGRIQCTLPPEHGSIEVTAAMNLIVARAPGNPILENPLRSTYNEGDSFTAKCVVPNGRPAANITWYLGEQQLLEGLHEPVITQTPDSDLETISQEISRVITADDGGRVLTCRAEHVALLQPAEAKFQFIVHYPPKRSESGPLTIFGLKLGAEGRLNVTVRANPPPTAEWTINELAFTAPHMTDDNSITALVPTHLGDGFYNITLVLSRVTKEDVERTYYLKVSNAVGREEVPVRISTMDEPAGVELDTGAIVGIVIAVLVLLIAVFLIVFAKATDRWCFAGGRNRDHTKSSGESTPAGDTLIETGIPLSSRTSDTESAVGGRERSRLAGLSARVLAALPRGRDKVQATEARTETEEKPLSEDKKSVVYAELQLGEQTSADKPPPPSTEYAEIVYSNQPQKTEVKE